MKIDNVPSTGAVNWPSAQDAAPAASGVSSVDGASRFREVLAAGDAPTDMSVPATGMMPVSDMGNEVLTGFDRLRTSLNSSWMSLSDSVKSTETVSSIQQVLQFQFVALNASLQYQVADGVVNKTEQGFDQLFKMQ